MWHSTTGPLQIAMLAALLLLSGGCNFLPKEEEETPAVVVPAPVRTEPPTYIVTRGRIVEQLTLPARVAPAQVAHLYFQQSGRVKAVYVRSGQTVQTGQLLAELHAEDAAWQLAQAEIRYRQAMLNLQDAVDRAGLNPDDPTAAREVERRELEVESARLEVEKWQRELAGARLVAPFDGQVILVGLSQGDAVSPYQVVITVADPTDLIIEADVDDAALPKLAVGQRVLLAFPGLESLDAGTVVEVPDPMDRASPAAGQARRAKVAVEGLAGVARLGATGAVKVVLQEKNDVLLLPNAAIRQFGGRTYVVLAEPRREVDVVVGIRGETESEIVQGLKEGDRVMGR